MKTSLSTTLKVRFDNIESAPKLCLTEPETATKPETKPKTQTTHPPREKEKKIHPTH
jgi:hypothetical protein